MNPVHAESGQTDSQKPGACDELARSLKDFWRLAEQKNFTRMKSEAQAMSHVNPAASEAMLGIMAALNGHAEEIEAHFQKALALAPDCPAIICNWGKSLYQTHDYASVIQILRSMGDKMPEAAYLLGMANLALGLERQADEYFRQCAQKPDSAEAFCPSKACEEALAFLEKSYTNDRAIWQSLSNR